MKQGCWTSDWTYSDLKMYGKQMVNTSNKKDNIKKTPLVVHRSIHIFLPQIKRP